MNDYSQFVLTEKEQKAFNKFKKKDTAELTINEYKLLVWKRLVDDIRLDEEKILSPDPVQISLTRMGKELRTYQREQRAKTRKENIRYGITTFIAIIALVLSIISICLKV